MTTFSILSPPNGSTAQKALTTLNPDDPDYSEASLLADCVAAGVVYTATQQDAINQIKTDIQASTDAVNLNEASGTLWNLREQIMSSSWPSDPTWQATLISDLNADAAVPLPAPPLAPPPASQIAGYTVDDAAAAQARARKILDDLKAAQQDSVTSGQSMEAFLASTNGDLVSSVSGWLTAQGLSDSGDSWSSALLPNSSGGYTLVDKSSLTTSWSIATPSVLTMSGNVDNGLWCHDSSGDVFPVTLLDAGTDSARNLMKAGYDTSLLPEAVRFDIFSALDTRYDYSYFIGMDGTKYLMLGSDSLQPSAQFPFQWPAAGSDPRYQNIAPAESSLGVAGGSTDHRYWSDGTTIYDVDYSNPSDLADSIGRSAKYSSSTDLFTQMMKNSAATTDGCVVPISRLPGPADVATFLGQAKQNIQSADNATSNWTALGQSQLVQLQEKVAEYGNAVNWVTNAQERLERVLNTMISSL